MSHLILTRRVGTTITLRLDENGDPDRLLQQLAGDGVDIHIVEVYNSHVRLSFDAPRDLNIVRSELLGG